MVFHWSLSDSKSPQVFRTLLSILAVLNNAVIWMISTRPPTSKSSSCFCSHFVTLPTAPITIGLIVTFMPHSFFFNFLARTRYLSFFSLSFSFILWSAGTGKSTILHVLSPFFILLLFIVKFRPGLRTKIRWSVCIWKSYRHLYIKVPQALYQSPIVTFISKSHRIYIKVPQALYQSLLLLLLLLLLILLLSKY